MARRATVMNEQVAELYPFFAREQPHQIGFDFFRTALGGKIQPARQALNMRVHDHAFSLFKGHAQDDIGRFSRDTGQLDKFLHGCRNLASVLLRDEPARPLDAFGFISEEAGGVNHLLQFRWIGPGKLAGRLVSTEQGWCDRVDHPIGALCRENRGDEQLQRVRRPRAGNKSAPPDGIWIYEPPDLSEPEEAPSPDFLVEEEDSFDAGSVLGAESFFSEDESEPAFPFRA